MGMLLWVITATLPFTLFYARLVSLGHAEQLSIGVVAGGAFVVAGIIRIATSVESGRYAAAPDRAAKELPDRVTTGEKASQS
jgi:hypothetical protein